MGVGGCQPRPPKFSLFPPFSSLPPTGLSETLNVAAPEPLEASGSSCQWP